MKWETDGEEVWQTSRTKRWQCETIQSHTHTQHAMTKVHECVVENKNKKKKRERKHCRKCLYIHIVCEHEIFMWEKQQQQHFVICDSSYLFLFFSPHLLHCTVYPLTQRTTEEEDEKNKPIQSMRCATEVNHMYGWFLFTLLQFIELYKSINFAVDTWK